jgi:hypothetical protein
VWKTALPQCAGNGQEGTSLVSRPKISGHVSLLELNFSIGRYRIHGVRRVNTL